MNVPSGIGILVNPGVPVTLLLFLKAILSSLLEVENFREHFWLCIIGVYATSIWGRVQYYGFMGPVFGVLWGMWIVNFWPLPFADRQATGVPQGWVTVSLLIHYSTWDEAIFTLSLSMPGVRNFWPSSTRFSILLDILECFTFFSSSTGKYDRQRKVNRVRNTLEFRLLAS